MRMTNLSTLYRNPSVFGRALDEQFGAVKSRTDWQERALCREVDPEIFFSKYKDEVESAIEICKECPVASLCLESEIKEIQKGTFSIADVYGVRAGYTEAQRRRLYRLQNILSARKAKTIK